MMKHQTQPTFISFLLSFVLLFTHWTPATVSLIPIKQQPSTKSLDRFRVKFLPPSLVKAQEVEDERDFDYVEGGKKGPAQWGDMKNEWAACKNGGLQSPIDLSDQRVQIVPSLGVLKINHKPSNATLRNRGHDIKLGWAGDAGSMEIDSAGYFLQQAHWHSPSEHLINGKRYDMELHMVYASPDQKVQNSIVVLGVLYEIGRPDAFLSKLMKHVVLMTNQKAERSIGVIDPEDIVQLGGSKNYYRYVGSLTIPPCTEGVVWIISKQFGTVSKEQINQLRVAVEDYAEVNARPVQPLNNREIQTSDESARNKHK